MGLFSKGPKPKVHEIVPLPDENDPNVLRQKRLSLLSAQENTGRASTIMGQGTGDTLGSTQSAIK